MARQNPRSTDELIARFAAAGRRENVVTRAELLRLDLSEDVIDRRLAGGFLRRVHPGVYAVGHAPLTPRGEIRAALVNEAPAAASGLTAAFVHRLLGDAVCPPHITTTNRGGRAKPGVHRVRAMPPTTIVDGLRVTTVERTLLDMAAMGDRRLQRALNEGLYKRLTNHDHLSATAAEPRKGCRVLREAIARGARTRSPLEDDFYAALYAAGLPLPIANASVGLYEVDFLWPEHDLVVETDGWAAHGHARARRNDPAKDAYLKTLGLHVIRISRARLEQRREAVLVEIAVALTRR